MCFWFPGAFCSVICQWYMYHQRIQVPNLEVLYLIFGCELGGGDSLAKALRSAYIGDHRWGFLHFRYLNFLAIYKSMMDLSRSVATRHKKDLGDIGSEFLTPSPGRCWCSKIHLWKLTFWTPKMEVWKMSFIFKGVNFQVPNQVSWGVDPKFPNWWLVFWPCFLSHLKRRFFRVFFLKLHQRKFTTSPPPKPIPNRK